jgi:hypothetical protein
MPHPVSSVEGMRDRAACGQGKGMNDAPKRHADDAHADAAPPTDAAGDEVRSDAAEAQSDVDLDGEGLTEDDA